jgi:hypothetical protein
LTQPNKKYEAFGVWEEAPEWVPPQNCRELKLHFFSVLRGVPLGEENLNWLPNVYAHKTQKSKRN